jgi:SOS-response transcriptional repressor LexA
MVIKSKTEFIWDYILKQCEAQGGVPPTVREIQAACQLSSTSVVNYHLNKLIEAGRIVKLSERRWYVNGGVWKYPA